jgi:hypothetical protein
LPRIAIPCPAVTRLASPALPGPALPRLASPSLTNPSQALPSLSCCALPAMPCQAPPCRATPCHALPGHAMPRRACCALPRLASPSLAEPRLALPAQPSRASAYATVLSLANRGDGLVDQSHDFHQLFETAIFLAKCDQLLQRVFKHDLCELLIRQYVGGYAIPAWFVN